MTPSEYPLSGSRKLGVGYPGTVTRRFGLLQQETSTPPSLCANGSHECSQRSPRSADLVLLAGDLTTHGLPEQAEVLADACDGLSVPVVAVLGNHDHHSGCADEVADDPSRRGVVRARRVATSSSSSASSRSASSGRRASSAGSRARRSRTSASRLLRQIYHETSLEVEALERGLEAVSGCHKRIVLLHYAPITETIVGEPEAIWAFLGLGPARRADRHASARARRPRARTPRRRAGCDRHRARAQRRGARDGSGLRDLRDLRMGQSGGGELPPPSWTRSTSRRRAWRDYARSRSGAVTSRSSRWTPSADASRSSPPS